MDYCRVSHASIQTDGTVSCLKTAPKNVRTLNLASVPSERKGGPLQQAIGYICVNRTAPRASLSREGIRRSCLKDVGNAHIGRKPHLTQGPLPATPTTGSVRAKDGLRNVWFSNAVAVQAEVTVESTKTNSVISTNPAAEKVYDSSYLTEETLVSFDSNFATSLHSISELYAEVGEDNRQAAEYLQDVEEDGKELRTISDYSRRAYLYGRVAEIVQARQKKGEKVCEYMEQLQDVVMEEDRGRSPADYMRRAEIFSKSAEVFGVDKK